MTTPTPDPATGGYSSESVLLDTVARLTAENEQLRAFIQVGETAAKVQASALRVERARVQAVRDLANEWGTRAMIPVKKVRAAVGDGDDRG